MLFRYLSANAVFGDLRGSIPVQLGARRWGMNLRDWLKASNVSIKSFAEEVEVERAMVYRYFTGAMPRDRMIRRIELLTDGAVTARDF